MVEFDNKTILIIGLIIMALVSMYCGEKDIALAISSGLVGYLSKDIVTNNTINNHNTEGEYDDEDV